MDAKLLNIQQTERELLHSFNCRIDKAFSDIYIQFGRELNIFAATLFNGHSSQTEDIVEDAIINLWLSKSNFESVKSLKAYLYVSIKNSYFRYLEHSKYVEKYRQISLAEENFETNIIEAEVYSFIDETLKILPELYAEVIRMYIDGWKSGDIALKLNRTEQSIYKIKHDALKILRKKMSKDMLLLITMLIK